MSMSTRPKNPSILRGRRMPAWKRVAGTTMMEVLISLLVLSGGMLGLAGVQSTSLRNNQAAYYRTLATTFTQDIVERMRANIEGVEDGGYDDVAGAATGACFTVVGCTDIQMAAQDILDWEAMVAAALPGAATVVCVDSTADDGSPGAESCDGIGNVYAIKIWWDDNRDGTSETRFVTAFQPL